ncbi:MAG: NUDIX hydrolase [Spirochaetia bacterium]|nr:NUDIX hydrolase [Spirochaetia bacterium]
MTEEKRYHNPTPTVDIIIEVSGGIVFIERGGEPKGYALPGGFAEEGETLEDSARREAKEETSLDVTLGDLLYVYSDPRRDPRKHTISAVYTAKAEGTPKAADDAKRIFVCPADKPPGPLAFDHDQIVKDYIRFKATGVRPTPAEIDARTRTL